MDSREHTEQWRQPRVYKQRQLKYFVSCSEFVIDFAMSPYLRQKKTLNAHYHIYWRACIRVRSLVAQGGELDGSKKIRCVWDRSPGVKKE